MFERLTSLIQGANIAGATATKKTQRDIAFEVIFGKWGSGKERKNKLTKAGYNYNKIQSIVNNILKKKSIDTIAQEVIDGKWGSGETRKKRLIKVGYDYNKVQNRVNEIIEGSKSIIDKEIDACKEQAEWMKNYKYEWESKPTVPKSKKKGTCVTYVACVLQRIGVLKSGQYIWHTGRGYGDGKVIGTNDKMTTTYMKNKTFTACKNKLKKGDIVLVDDNKSGKSGNGGHVMIFAGKWSASGEPYIYDNASCERVKDGKKAIRTYSKSRKILAIVRLK